MKKIVEDKGVRAVIDFEVIDQKVFEAEVKTVLEQLLDEMKGVNNLPVLEQAVDDLAQYNKIDIIQDYYMNRCLLILIAGLRLRLTT